MKRFPLLSPEALAESLHLAFLVGLIDAGNDNARPHRPNVERSRRLGNVNEPVLHATDIIKSVFDDVEET